MKRRHILKTGALAAAALTFGISTTRAASGILGKMGADEWKKTNADAGASVKALSAGDATLSEDDGKLLKEIAAAGTMQLKLSEVAVKQCSSEDVRMIASAEAEEQTIIGEKLKEIAKAGSVSLPDGPDEATRNAVEKLKGMKGLELDKHYLKTSGIDGHEKLKDIMEKVASKAESSILKALAATTLPVIKIHLQVAEDESSDMKKAE